MSAKSLQHPQALVESEHIGEGTRVWANAHILPGARIGADCNINDLTFIENDVVLGDRVTIKCGVHVWDGVRIEDDVFVGPNATFTNDLFPRSRQYLDAPVPTVLRKGCSIGANATILAGVTIGQHAMVGAGAVVTRSVPPHAVVAGNPARILRYSAEDRSCATEAAGAAPTASSRVPGVRVIRAPLVKDMRGNLSARQIEDGGLPFLPRRYFVVLDVPSKEVRGAHAHHECEQLLCCLKGSVACVVDDGVNRDEFRLDTPETALYLPPMVWGIQYKYSEDAVLLVLASHPYDADDYIRDYDQFLEARAALPTRS